MGEKDLIDLTNSDTEDGAVNPLNRNRPAEKRRDLPATVMFRPHQQVIHNPYQQPNQVTAYAQLQQPTVYRQPQQYQNSYQANLQARMIHQQPSVDAVCRNMSICFSLINPREFTVRAETGPVPAIVINALKVCPGVRFEYNIIRWQFPLYSHDGLLKSLRQLGCWVEPIPRHVLAAACVQTGSTPAGEEIVNELKSHGVDDKVIQSLAPFQREAVRFVISKNGRALVADEMGLGKTRTAIGAACVYKSEWPVLILCPSSARHHWQQEILNVVPEHVLEPRQITVVDSSHHPLRATNFDYQVVIISYNMAVTKIDQLLPFKFQVIIADESHYLKSKQSKRTKSLVPMIKDAKRAILLSGTPALSRPLELYSQLNALDPGKWNDLKEFGKRYCRDARPSSKKGLFNSHNRFSWGENGYKGSNNTTELHFILSATVMIRRLKKDILLELPPKHRYLLKITVEDEVKRNRFLELLSKISKYEELIASRKRSKHSGDASSLLPSSSSALTITGEGSDENGDKKQVILQLFNESGEAKLPSVLKYIDNYLAKDNAGKILVFAHHKVVIDGLCKFFREKSMQFIKIDGTTSSKDRHAHTQRFQNDADVRVAVLGITAAGIALTLTAANVVFFAEMYWTPGSLIQAEDRVHRIGQLREVKVFYFFAENSVDELLWPLVRKKMKVFGEFIEGRLNADMGASLFKSKTGSSSSSNEPKPAVDTSAKSSDIEVIDAEDTDNPVVEKIIGDVEAFEAIAQELALEERNAEEPVVASSNRKRKASEGDDEDDDEEASEPDNEYEDYLNQPERPDVLALEYMRQYKEHMAKLEQQKILQEQQKILQEQQQREHLLRQKQTQRSNDKIEVITLEDEEVQGKKSTGNHGVIDLINSDDEEDIKFQERNESNDEDVVGDKEEDGGGEEGEDEEEDDETIVIMEKMEDVEVKTDMKIDMKEDKIITDCMV